MTGGRPHAVALLCGIALAFAWPQADVAPLAWIALVPLLALAARERAGRAALVGAAFGVGFFGVLLVWISLIGWVAWGVLVALQAAFVALFAALWSVAGRTRRGWAAALLAPALWVSVDYLRSKLPLGGFPWGQLAQSQHDLTWLLRLAGLGGAWLVTAVVVWVNSCVLEAVRARRAAGPRAAWPYAAAGVLALGVPALLPGVTARGPSLRVAIVQGGVPQRGTEFSDVKELAIVRSHARLTKALAPQHPDLVVWPESSVGLDPRSDPRVAHAIGAAARTVGAPMIVGANFDAGPDHYYVMALEVSPRGRVVDSYRKTHLVPFGEYVPARALLDWIPMLDQIPRDAVAGHRGVLFDVGGGKVAPVISFEGDFGSLVRRRIESGGRLLVVATNTSTWGRSWASAQHVAFSQLRAAENGVWVVHAALSGISAFVSPDGVTRAETPLQTATSVVREVRFASGVTLYTRLGDWLPIGCLAASAVVLAATVLGARARSLHR